MFATMMLLGSILYILHEAQLLMFLVLHLFKFVFSAIVIEAQTFLLFLLRFSMRVFLHRIVCGGVPYTYYIIIYLVKGRYNYGEGRDKNHFIIWRKLCNFEWTLHNSNH